MKQVYGHFLLLFAIAFCLSFSVFPSHAATMDVTSFTSMSGDCHATLSIEHNFTISGTTVDITSPDRDAIALVLFDGEGDAFAYIGISVGIGFSGAVNNQPWIYPYIEQPKSRPFTMVIYDNTTVVTTASGNLAGAQHGTILDVIHYDPVDYGVCGFLPVHTGPDVSIPPFTDGRINNWDTASPIVVYGQDFDNQRGLVVYSDTGDLLLVIHPTDLIDCPDVNTLILSGNGVRFYRLSSCEYQLMAPSVEAGKTYTLIFTDLYANTGYQSYEE